MFAGVELAEAYLLDGSNESAISALSEYKDDEMQDGVNNGLDFAKLHRLLACAYLRIGQFDEFEKYYNRSLEFHRKTKPYKDSLLSEVILHTILDAEHSFSESSSGLHEFDESHLNQNLLNHNHPLILIHSAYLLARLYSTLTQSDKHLPKQAEYLKFLNSLTHDFEHVRNAKSEYNKLLVILTQQGLAETDIKELKLNAEQRKVLLLDSA